MARARPVRTSSTTSGAYRNETPPGRKPRGDSPPFSGGLTYPTAEKPPDFRDHTAYVLILSVG